MPVQVESEISGALARWHALDDVAAEAALLALCGSRHWARRLAEGRPFENVKHLEHAATNVWFLLGEADWLEAFGCHPRIGERARGDGAFAAHSGKEQAEALGAMDGCEERLAAGNRAYEARFGFTYIVFANGRTARDLLAALEARLGHDRGTELQEAAREQHKITALRMGKWLDGGVEA